MTEPSDLELERLAAVACGREGPDNCRHDWNEAHPEDQVTEAEQRAWAARILRGEEGVQ